MKQSIHIFPKIAQIDAIRKKYDSFYDKWLTHLTLVYAFEVEDQKRLNQHIIEATKGIKPFEISFGKFYASDNYVCLEVKSKECCQLYHELNRGVLADFENKEVPYQPHISIAVLEDEKQAKALEEKLNKTPLLKKLQIDSIYLSNIGKDNLLDSKKRYLLI